MQHMRTTLFLAAITAMLSTWLYFFWGLSAASAASSSLHIDSLSLIVSPTPSSTATGQAPPPTSIDPAIIAALIGLFGVIVGAVIAGQGLWQVSKVPIKKGTPDAEATWASKPHHLRLGGRPGLCLIP